MRICILTHTFPRFSEDTTAPFMRGVAEGMVAAGNEVFVLTPYSGKFKKDKRYFRLITYKYILPDSLHRLGYSETLENDMSLKPGVYLLSPLMLFFAAIALYRLVKKEKIEIINAHWILPNGFIACVVGKLTGVPVVSTLPGSDVYIANKNFLFGWMAKFAAKNSKAITSNSPQLLNDLEKVGADRKKFSTIIYGVDPEKFKPQKKEAQSLRKKLNISKEETIILGVGRLVAKKGFKYLIEAAPTVLKKIKNAKFVIVGDGDQKQELEVLAFKKNLSGKIIHTGTIDYKKLVNYYNLADIFILPSIRDEKGNLDDQSVSVMEAMACGKPVISTDFPGYKMVVKNEVNGYLVKEADSKEIAKSLIKIASSHSLREKMGQKSRELVLNNFSWKAIGKQYTELFQSLAQNSYSEALPSILEVSDRERVAGQILKVLQSKRRDLKNLDCLDVGCSSGVITNFLSGFLKKIIGVDVDSNAIEKAQSTYKASNLSFWKVNDEKLLFKDNSFDVVICNQVYNFVNDYNLLMNEIHRVLKPGGVCFFSARNKYAILEPQYKLLFLSWLPERLAAVYLKLMGKGEHYYGKNYLSYFGLKKLVSRFRLYDYTFEILKNPRKFGFNNLQKYSVFAKILPSDLLFLFIPNYIWILSKK